MEKEIKSIVTHRKSAVHFNNFKKHFALCDIIDHGKH